MTDGLIGAWTLNSFQVRHSNGNVSYPFGEDAIGSLMYDPSGRFSGLAFRRGRTKFAVDDTSKGTDPEIREAFSGSVAYYGSFSIDGPAGKVTHHVDGSVFPNWEGGDQVRFFSLKDGVLRIETPPTLWGGDTVVFLLEWRRAG